ncbi:MAG TPA: TRAP transporter small permease [Firmicutes bacterium]|nr:TRAP transporter small permease [Bacillota bacterium]
MRAWDRLFRLIEGAGTIGFCAFCIVVFLQVVFRFVLRYPAPWTEELARYLLVWVMFLGAAVSSKEGTHLVASNLVARLVPTAEKWSQIWAELCVFVCAASLARGSLLMTRMAGTETATSFLWLKMSAVFAIMPVCFTLMAVSAVVRIGALFRKLRSASEGGRAPCS